ncbi:cache domain-containing sensor histidine kinase [Paenibacillus odorifer]|uniref:cache domain-containing sensor histidine kinase n=1 Tax=Paenibacillus odorifer TaxID=189426 RepID=UPI00096C7775|nr:sensor histidine kinase [Paenibacillus odorifer]OME48490.1 hypothetical protein BSK59_26210 [Paenibacillus odorifer]OME52500.1 hypothetical protein BSK61_18505 [Paenibacillus odorifer]
MRGDSLVKWFGRLQIRNKIILIFIPLIIFPLLALGLLSGQMFSRSMIEKAKYNFKDESKLIMQQIDTIVKNTESSANIITTDIHRMYAERPLLSSMVEQTRFRNLMQSQLSIDLIIFPDVDSAVFVDTEGQIYSSYAYGNPNEQKVFTSDMLEKAKEKGSYGVNRWLPMEQRDYLVSDPAIPVLTLSKVVYNLKTGNLIGTLFVNVKEDALSAFLETVRETSSDKKYFVVDGTQRTVSTPDKSKLLLKPEDRLNGSLRKTGSSVSEIIGKGSGRELVTVTYYDKLNWKLVNTISLQKLTADIHRNITLTIFVGIGCLLLSLLLAGKLSQIIVNPLLQVTKAMRKVREGDLNVTSPVTTEDETGLISTVFNSMVGRIQELMRTITNEQVRKREYELALIHAQIKPHFLYNTLDTIYVLNDLELNEAARDTTKALADFYRVVLSKGNEVIPLSEEVSNAADYLAIMQVRNPDVLRYEINIPKSLEGVKVPKLSLQPLIENAIYHGLKTKGSQGLISIEAYTHGREVIITVEDNGVGMSGEQVSRIVEYRSREGKPASIGIYSVHERIKLYFGEPYGLSVESKLGKGTVMKMTIPGTEAQGGSIDV